MTAKPHITLVALEKTTSFAPLVALGFYVREQDLLAPVFSRLKFGSKLHVEHPAMALLDLWVSILAGCRSVSHINTRLRPDRVLAQAWGRSSFHEQSSVARILDSCQAEHVYQLRAGIDSLYRWIGQAPQQVGWVTPLMVDIDLTGLPAGPQAEGSTKGYFSGKKGRAADNSVESGLLTTTKV
jgi:hypothetical protein